MYFSLDGNILNICYCLILVKNVGGPNLWGPHTVGAMKDKPIRSVISGCCAAHSVVIDTAGCVYSWGMYVTRTEKLTHFYSKI